MINKKNNIPIKLSIIKAKISKNNKKNCYTKAH